MKPKLIPIIKKLKYSSTVGYDLDESQLKELAAQMKQGNFISMLGIIMHNQLVLKNEIKKLGRKIK